MLFIKEWVEGSFTEKHPRRFTGSQVPPWGDGEQLTALNEQEKFVLADNFDVDKFGRAIAKIANGVIAGECGLESFEPFLADYILGNAPEQGAVLIGKWPKDGKPRPAGILHQVGRAFRNFKGRDYVAV